MTATSHLLPNMFTPKVSVTHVTHSPGPFNMSSVSSMSSPPSSLDNFGFKGGRRRSRCISCSDSSLGSSFEESSSFLLESTLLPRRVRTASVCERIQVSYRLCPIPPKFEKCQAVHVTITRMSTQSHKRWDTPETPEDVQTDDDLSNHPPPADV
eukprot:GFUD01123662.1.p1 GENE.GFUD01123662.1~~GFUD01123662.1.p1  ORF type:complete len:154 (+),score=38.83 GFUD01123662.1:361-822(+)